MLPWTKITYLGDTSLMAPAALLIGLWLLAVHRQRLLWYWCALLGSALALVAATKIAFLGWGIGIPALNFTGFSGHATFATAVLPVMAFLLLQRRPVLVRAAGVLFGLGLGLLVGMSRLRLGVHSGTEVIAGCMLGALVSLGFVRVSGSVRPAVLNLALAGVGLALLFAASYTQAAPTQRLFVHVALYLSGHDQPYVRGAPTDFSTRPVGSVRLAYFRYPAPNAGARDKRSAGY